ncbi:low molecular weight protein-tyrosine-phosphatase [Eubacterium oxidoreducens]|uniref:protein-tyrosine-phosphatase n=1 Tax=Eubacterium oxidoreducens TaxID=1732 RepID=A0A1G6BI63_EUBOX|nr:low molecular weight protein-tyrosine-phosphatase [Eubacterium oxidoreducens]SDB20310.1 protein-tyrosine phosphatase [Eubacterium oxidoreducens]
MIKILFICHGNICRSTMAQFVFQHMVNEAGMADRFYIDSAATSTEEIGSGPHPGTVHVCNKEGVPVLPHKAKQVRRQDYDTYDLLIIMDEENRRGLSRIISKDKQGKVHKLMEYAGMDKNVADPWYTGDFETTYWDVSCGCKALMEELTKSEN